MIEHMKPKDASVIINSLMAGVVPKEGIQYMTVGRSKEIAAMLKSIEDVKRGQSMVKFWIGEFGSGKSFMLHLLRLVALKQKFVTASVDFTPERRLYANDRKAVASYSTLMDNLCIQTKPDGGALETLLEKWIEQVMLQTAQEGDIPFDQLKNKKNLDRVKANIMKTVDEITGVGGFDLGWVIVKYVEGYMNHDDLVCKHALKWLKGEYTTKTEARQDLGVRSIIDDQNYYDMLKNFTRFVTDIGYSGLMINFDEADNLYKISFPQIREKNYEKILSIYNDCFQGKMEHLFINFAGSGEFLENERRGLFSYRALKTRLEANPFETAEIRDFSQPVIRILPLDHDEIFVLLQKLRVIFDFHHAMESRIDETDIHHFMEAVYNKPGAREFLTPREVIKDFLHILSILRQNPGLEKDRLFKSQQTADGAFAVSEVAEL
ncbi:MAG: ATP-binding protein [Candidatus Omnitrophota bacterium]